MQQHNRQECMCYLSASPLRPASTAAAQQLHSRLSTTSLLCHLQHAHELLRFDAPRGGAVPRLLQQLASVHGRAHSPLQLATVHVAVTVEVYIRGAQLLAQLLGPAQVVGADGEWVASDQGTAADVFCLSVSVCTDMCTMLEGLLSRLAAAVVKLPG